MKVFWIFLLEVIVAEPWKYIRPGFFDMSYYTNYTSSEINHISNLSETCFKHGKTQLLEIHDGETAFEVDDLLEDQDNIYYNVYYKDVKNFERYASDYSKHLNTIKSYKVPLNLMRVEETKWAWSNDNIGSSSFDQNEIIKNSSQNPWYAYLDCAQQNCIYKPGVIEQKYFICQIQGNCTRKNKNQFEYEGTNNKTLCYSKIQEKKYWTEARQVCLVAGGKLATFKDLKLNEVKELVKGNEKWWVGLQKARWLWKSSGKEAIYTRWGEKEPKYLEAGINENRCVISVGGKWQAKSCKGVYGLVCMKNKYKYEGIPNKPFRTFRNEIVLHDLSTAQISPIQSIFYKVALPIIIFLIVFIILVLILIFILVRKQRGCSNDNNTKSLNKNFIPKTNTKTIIDENDPIYTTPETDCPQYLKVINVSAADTNGINVKKIFLPPNKDFQKQRRKEVKSALYDENVVFKRDVSVLYNIEDQEKNDKSNKITETKEVSEEDEDHFYDKLSFSNSIKDYMEPRSHPELQTVNSIFPDEKTQRANYYKENQSENKDMNIIDNDKLDMNPEIHPQGIKKRLESTNKDNNFGTFYLSIQS